MPQPKDKVWLNGYKNKTPIHVVHKDDINIWRDITYSWVGRINLVKVNILRSAIYRCNAIPIRLPMAFFRELEQKNFHS